jgi:signal transduction histidine kinase
MSDSRAERASAVAAWIRRGLVTGGQALVLGVLFFVGCLVLFVLSVISISFIGVLGVGVLLVPVVMVAVRALANERRRLAQQWSGVHIPVPYRPRPQFAASGAVRAWQRFRWLLTDPATWRDLLWMLLAPVGLALGLLPAALVQYGVVDCLVGIRTGDWLAPPRGALFVALGLAIGPTVLRLHTRFSSALLAPTRPAELAVRVQHLTRTRSETVDAQAAELRRIERDLHDGAQARLVALSMSLGLAEDLVAEKPAAAQELLAEARQASTQALSELRDLVRGIHPPVLAERGVDGAVRALALSLPLDVEVDIELAGRPQAPVESAAYFAVAETLANVAKHSAARHARVLVRHAGGGLRIMVSDDGVGGADPRNGTGLRGIQRRLAAFDGTLAVTSPPGGPTVVTMELPCELSLPKTSPYSGTG